MARSTPTALSQARDYLAATNVGNYALFGGGHATGSSYYSKVVDAYGTSLTRTTPTVLSKGGEYLAATSVGNYALFGGGNSGGSATNRVDAYDTSLIRTTPTALSQSRESLAATNVGNYALFGGGWLKSIIDAYDTSLTRTTPTELSEARSDLAATNIGNYALFGGGDNGKNYSSSTVDAYDATLTRTTPTKLSQSRMDLAATTVVPAGSSNPQSGYALFGGGRERIGNRIGNYFSTVDSYDATLTKTTPTPTALSQAMSHLIATTVGNYALFGGGWNGNSCLNVIDAYDTSLTRSTPTELSQARSFLAATTIGDYALFGGGYDDSTFSAVVDAYSPVSSYNIQLFPDTKYSFNSSTEQISSTMQTITMEPPIVGYIKIKNTTVT